MGPLWIDKPVYIYGPAYFGVTSLVARLFPFDIFAFRLPCLVFSLGVVVLLGLVLRSRKVAPAIALWTCVLLALDPTVYKSSHSGRMDSTILFFILLSLLTLPARTRAAGGASVGRALLSGVAAGLALLTTPRPAYLLVLLGCILAYRVARERSRERVIELAVWSGSLTVLYGIWFFYAFGSVANLLAITGAYRASIWADSVSVWCTCRCWRRCSCSPSRREPEAPGKRAAFFVGAGIAGFYVVVREPGVLYSFFMVVLAYLGIGYLAAQLLERNRRTLPLVVLSSLLMVNALSYLARNAFIAAQWAASDSRVVDQAVAAQIPKGSRVIGDDKYFFAVRKAGSEFQYIARGGTPEERVAYHRDVFRADYLITDLDERSELLQEYVREMPLTKTGSIPGQPPGPLARQLLRLANAFHFTARNRLRPDALGPRGDLWPGGQVTAR